MTMNVSKVDIWEAAIEDRPGGLAEKLAPLAEAGASLQFVLARRTPEKPGAAVLFLTPLRGAKQLAAARKAGLRKSSSLAAVRIEGPDKPGLGARITQALADAGVNLRGLCATVIGKRYVLYLALDKPADAAKTLRVLRGIK